ncbi:TORTIFOLIA1-like protein 3 [Primulina tabacum]|uniref:TORTIFOLIA1-like protein 3 n=1 Tax=Primulina tabacum TaxID=48773 RepID=UPI003F591EFD
MHASNSKQAQAREFKHRVLTCLHKLSDRDTHSAAATELESIAKTLPAASLPTFLSSISATDSSDKSPVRRQCLRLVSVLSENHGNSLSPHLSKILTSIVRRLRDPDSSVRTACVAAALSLSSHVTNPPFTSLTKPFLESLFVEQDIHTQTGAALCLAAIIEGSRSVDVGSLRRLLPRLQKLGKCDSFKAKAALLVAIGIIVGVKGVLSNCGKIVIKNLVVCLVEFLSSDDWAARKAAAEALVKVVAVEKDSLSEYKDSCLKSFEAKKFDKVKAAREAMNLLIEVWKEIPDLSGAESPPPGSQASAKEKANDGCPLVTKSYIGSTKPTPHVRRRIPLENPPCRTTPLSDNSPVSTARKGTTFGSNENKSRPAMFRKLDLKKSTSNGNVEIAVPIPTSGSSGASVFDDNPLDKEDSKQFEKPEFRRALFDETGDAGQNQRECEDLTHIRNQLVQIENQQSHLLDLLQRFMGNSQIGMQSLEARVHGLELALDEISLDLAVSTGRMSQNNADGSMCCKLPSTNFLTWKLWGRTEGRSSTSRLLTSCGTPAAAAARGIDRNGDDTMPRLENRGYQVQGGLGIIKNPLADTRRA